MEKEHVGVPPRISTRMEGGDLIFERKWLTPAVIGIFVFCVFWDGFLYLFAMARSKGGGSTEGLITLLMLPHFYVGIGLTYFLFCLLFNKTVFRVSPVRIKVEVGPLPAFGNKEVPTEQVNQFYCRKIVGSKGGVTYRLMLLKADGKKIALGGNFSNREEVIYLEQEIEQMLGIQDRLLSDEDSAQISDSPKTLREALDRIREALGKDRKNKE